MDEFLALGSIQHFAFCRRQWALIYIEQQWEDNLRTVEGEIMHKNAHNPDFREKRKNTITVRGMAVCSKVLRVNGVCDVVEFKLADDGVPIHGWQGLYSVCPVEYKRGSPKRGEEDILQLTGQAICLEEMLCCDIPKGFLYYGETRRRHEVEFTRYIRERVSAMYAEMRELYVGRHTPSVKPSKSCNACSLNNICLPKLLKTTSAKAYINRRVEETAECEN